MKYTAFISHSTKDAAAVGQIRSFLEEHGYTCFVSGRNLKHNAEWQKQLVDSMLDSKMLIYVHSGNSNTSPEVGREINYFADKCHRPILVYRLSDTEYARDRAYYLQSINHIDSLGSATEGLAVLRENVEDVLKGNGLIKKLPFSSSNSTGTLITVALAALAVVTVFGFLISRGIKSGSERRRLSRYESAKARTEALKAEAQRHIANEDSLEFVIPCLHEAVSIADGFKSRYGEGWEFDCDEQGLMSMAIARLDSAKVRFESFNASMELLLHETPDSLRGAFLSTIATNKQRINQIDSILLASRNEKVNTILPTDSAR